MVYWDQSHIYRAPCAQISRFCHDSRSPEWGQLAPAIDPFQSSFWKGLWRGANEPKQEGDSHKPKMCDPSPREPESELARARESQRKPERASTLFCFKTVKCDSVLSRNIKIRHFLYTAGGIALGVWVSVAIGGSPQIIDVCFQFQPPNSKDR